MPSKLNKVQKRVTKKKGSNLTSLHENSRDARRLRRAGTRDDRVSKIHSLRRKENGRWLERITFLQDNLPDTLHPLEIDVIVPMVKEFVDRHDEEIDQLKSERRAGRPASTRQTALEQARQVDHNEFSSGFWMPNLQDEETLTRLDKWDGRWLNLSSLRFVRVTDKGELLESQFPPRGAS